MGREIRRVIPNWEHPRQPCKHSPWRGGCDDAKRNNGMCFRPLYDRSYSQASREWKEAFAAWERGEYPDYADEESKKLQFWEWDGMPPEPEDYRPEWKDEDATWFQVYETVSEGTPVTPAFATKEELVEFLCANRDFWGDGPRSRKTAEAFVKDEWVPSMTVVDGEIYENMEVAKLHQAKSTG